MVYWISLCDGSQDSVSDNVGVVHVGPQGAAGDVSLYIMVSAVHLPRLLLSLLLICLVLRPVGARAVSC